MKHVASSLLVFATALLATPGLRAQAPLQIPDRYSFYLVRGADTVVVERVWRTPEELHGEFLARQRGGRLQYLATLRPDGSR